LPPAVIINWLLAGHVARPAHLFSPGGAQFRVPEPA
jgi:hypothetical protein